MIASAPPIGRAAAWLEGTLLGSVAMVATVIALAALGLLMLSGRIDARRGAAAMLGCVLLFGTALLVAGLGSGSDLGF